MDRKEFKLELIKLYARCGSYIVQCGCYEKGEVFTTTFKHPTQHKIIEMTESMEELLCVLVYEISQNARNRNCVECKTLEQFKLAIG